jgi:hypothetical protein
MTLIDTDVKRLVHNFARGISEMHYTSVVMQSEHFVIFRVKGHTDWSGVGSRSYYPSRHILALKDEWWLTTDGRRREWEGRVSRKELQYALDEAEKAGRIQ